MVKQVPWSDERPTAWDYQIEPASAGLDPILAEFMRRHPGQWTVRLDARTRAPSLLYGPGALLSKVALPEGSSATVQQAARAFLAENDELLRLAPYELSGKPVLAGNTWIMDFQLTAQGIAFEEAARVSLRIKTDGSLAALKLMNIPFDMEPPVPDRSFEGSLATIGGLLDRRARTLGWPLPRLAWWVDEYGTGRLAWRVTLRGALLGEPFALEFFTHARGDHEVLEVRDLLLHQAQQDRAVGGPGSTGSRLFGGHRSRDYNGTARGRVLVGGPDDGREMRAMPHMRVDVTQYGNGTTFTSTAGLFLFRLDSSHPLGFLRIAAEARGLWCDVDNAAGEDIRIRLFRSYLQPFNFLFNFVPSASKTAQMTAYYWVTRAHDWSSAILGDNGVERSIRATVNWPDTCNAFYNPTTGGLTFFDEGGSCPNMAFSDVIAHEYGHAIDDGQGGVLNTAYSEGFGDAVAMALTQQPLVGRGTPFERSGENVRRWPPFECAGEPHCIGEVYGGFTWELAQQLSASLGASAGRALADRLILLPAAANPISIPDAVFETFVADDDDASLNNGTPHFCEIFAAARSRSLATPPPVDVVRYGFNSPANPGLDSSGSGLNGSTDAVYIAGGGVGFTVNGALAFDLNAPHETFSVPDSPLLDLTGPMTGSAWIYPIGDHDTNPPNCSDGTVLTKGYNYWFQVNHDNSGLLFQNDPSGAPGTFVRVTVAPGFIVPGRWTHVAFVRPTATSVRLFVNGQRIGAGSLLAPSANASPLTIGNPPVADACEFNGRIDEVRIFSRALCDREVRELYCSQALCVTGQFHPGF